MTTIATMQEEVYKSLGDRDDASAQVWALRGINVGVVAFALLIEPPELRTSGYGNAVAAGTVININTNLTRPIRIERVYNNTRSCVVSPVPFRMWDLYPFPSSGYTAFYAMHGYNLYYKPLPASTEQLELFYFQYPAVLGAADDYPFKGGEGFVLSMAQRWAWACQEEQEDADMWAGISTDLAMPEKTVSEARKYIREELGYELKLQDSISKSSP